MPKSEPVFRSGDGGGDHAGIERRVQLPEQQILADALTKKKQEFEEPLRWPHVAIFPLGAPWSEVLETFNP